MEDGKNTNINIEYMNKIIYDLHRYTGSKGGFLKSLLLIPGFRFTYLLRISEKFQKNFILIFILKIILRRYQIKYGFQISYKTKIGKGFFIGHHGMLVISNKAVIGQNCNINHGVTIGQTSRGEKKGAPTIGNKVWIGANSVVVGKINIGDNVLISPGSFVNFDVPKNSLVIGNPAKIIPNQNATLGYINRVLNE